VLDVVLGLGSLAGSGCNFPSHPIEKEGMEAVVDTVRALPTWAKALIAAGGLYALREVVERVGEKSVAGEVALVTGAGSGIGRLMAIKLAGLKARVVLWDINKAAVETVGAWCSRCAHNSNW
jgi:hypothetical protein